MYLYTIWYYPALVNQKISIFNAILLLAKYHTNLLIIHNASDDQFPRCLRSIVLINAFFDQNNGVLNCEICFDCI